jgi:predicted metal-dependent HD superfamily phosphohydrolase
MREIKEFSTVNSEKGNGTETEWISVLNKFDIDEEESKGACEEIIKNYNSETRAYHNMKHIENLLKFINQRKGNIKDYDSMRLAVWFHDVVYDTKAKDNEEQSAIYARRTLEKLGIPEDIIMKVEKLILATFKHENIDNNGDCSIFLDGDLSVLSEDDVTYDLYAKSIRKEYSWVPEEQYRKGRKQILESFLKRERIYFTDEMFEKFEASARENLKREIRSLE